MPVYTYRREDGTTFDFRQKFMDEPLAVDPTTGQHVVRVVQPAGIIFKGSGFYVNDSKSGSRNSATSAPKPRESDGEKSEKSENHATETKAEAKESKTETKSEAKSEVKESKAESKSESKVAAAD